MKQSDLIHRDSIRSLYQMSINGLYSELLDEVVAHMVQLLGEMKTTVGSNKLLKGLSNAKTDGEKMIAIDAVIHKAHTSGFYAQHLIQSESKKDIISFLSELAGINDSNYKALMVRLEACSPSTVPGHALYSTIDFSGFEELNKTAIRDTQARFKAMDIKEFSFTGKTLLDVGCNIGHMLFETSVYGFPISHGLECSSGFTTAGNAIAEYLRMTDRITIHTSDVNKLTVDKLKALTDIEQFDVVFCFTVDGYIQNPSAFYKLLYNITKEVLYFEPNNHKLPWAEDGIEFIKTWGFNTVNRVTVPYAKNTGSTRNCFICHK